KSGITSMEKLMASPVPVKMGGLAPGNDADNITRLMRAVANLPVKIVEGYKGTTEIRLAMEQGEIAGSCLNWISTRSAWSKVLQKGDAVVVVQAVAEPISDLPNVPLSINYAKTDEARQLIEAGIHSPGIFARPFLLPPGTPMEQTKILTGAFRDTMNDKEFLADAKKSKLDIDPIGAADLEKAVASIFKLDSAMLGKLKDILFK
ncbi:MAG: hypothetical protein Q8P24_20455, partial [Desulfobacterales bacterium]|nr:hypothetical protein [Desulfobacterales bacterium]